MKSQRFFSCYTINYEAVNKLEARNFLLTPTEF